MPKGTREMPSYDERYATHTRELLAKFCDANGGQTKAAAMLGTKQATISRVLKGDRGGPPQQPQFWLIIALAEELGMTLEQVTGYRPSRSALDQERGATLAEMREVREMREEMAELRRELGAARRQSSHVRERDAKR